MSLQTFVSQELRRFREGLVQDSVLETNFVKELQHYLDSGKYNSLDGINLLLSLYFLYDEHEQKNREWNKLINSFIGRLCMIIRTQARQNPFFKSTFLSKPHCKKDETRYRQLKYLNVQIRDLESEVIDGSTSLLICSLFSKIHPIDAAETTICILQYVEAIRSTQLFSRKNVYQNLVSLVEVLYNSIRSQSHTWKTWQCVSLTNTTPTTINQHHHVGTLLLQRIISLFDIHTDPCQQIEPNTSDDSFVIFIVFLLEIYTKFKKTHVAIIESVFSTPDHSEVDKSMRRFLQIFICCWRLNLYKNSLLNHIEVFKEIMNPLCSINAQFAGTLFQCVCHSLLISYLDDSNMTNEAVRFRHYYSKVIANIVDFSLNLETYDPLQRRAFWMSIGIIATTSPNLFNTFGGLALDFSRRLANVAEDTLCNNCSNRHLSKEFGIMVSYLLSKWLRVVDPFTETRIRSQISTATLAKMFGDTSKNLLVALVISNEHRGRLYSVEYVSICASILHLCQNCPAFFSSMWDFFFKLLSLVQINYTNVNMDDTSSSAYTKTAGTIFTTQKLKRITSASKILHLMRCCIQMPGQCGLQNNFFDAFQQSNEIVFSVSWNKKPNSVDFTDSSLSGQKDRTRVIMFGLVNGLCVEAWLILNQCFELRIENRFSIFDKAALYVSTLIAIEVTTRSLIITPYIKKVIRNVLAELFLDSEHYTQSIYVKRLFNMIKATKEHECKKQFLMILLGACSHITKLSTDIVVNEVQSLLIQHQSWLQDIETSILTYLPDEAKRRLTNIILQSKY